MFNVDKYGKICNIRPSKSANTILAKEAIRLVENMPPWQPARSRDDDITPVKSRSGLTIPFELY